MSKIDFKAELNKFYVPSARVINIVDVPVMNFLMLSVEGGRDSIEVKEGSDAIMRLSYTIKFIIKKNNPEMDYVAMPLESLRDITVNNHGLNYDNSDMTNYDENKVFKWTFCIMQPPCATKEVLDEGVFQTSKKKNINLKNLEEISFEPWKEGLGIQIMHLGPYIEIGKSVYKLNAYLDYNSYEPTGKYHEIYVGDLKRARPENLKTIIRQPIKLKNSFESE